MSHSGHEGSAGLRAVIRGVVRSWFRFGDAGRWIGYGALIGLFSGLVAAGFFELLELAKYHILVNGAGASVAAPAGEHVFPEVGTTPYRAWLFFLLPAVGGLISGILVYTWAPEAEGHGTDSMVDAFHNKAGFIRARVPFLKGAATIATIATGGSAGREGPIAQIAGGVGSYVATRLHMTARERRIVLLAGTAGGLGAIFRAPLGGAIVAIEVLYQEDFESEALLPAVVSSVMAYALFAGVFGHQRIFAIPPLHFTNPLELLWYLVLGLVCVVAGVLYVRIFYGVRDWGFRPLPIPRHVKPMVGGLVVGLIGFWIPGVYGGGWGQIQHALTGHLAIWTLLGIGLAKMVATSVTIGSGGSGGVFGPTLFIGGMLGGAVGLVGHQIWPGVVVQPAAYVLVGMSAFFAGVANAPLGALLMTTEMTGGYDLVAPLLLVSAIALVFTRGFSIYEKQVKDKFHSPAHLGDMTVDVMSSLTVEDAFEKEQPIEPVAADMPFLAFRDRVEESDATLFPVMTKERVVGVVDLESARSALFSHDPDLQKLLVVQDIAMPAVTVYPFAPLNEVLHLVRGNPLRRVIVLARDKPGVPLGFLRYEGVLAAYQRELERRRRLDEEALYESDASGQSPGGGEASIHGKLVTGKRHLVGSKATSHPSPDGAFTEPTQGVDSSDPPASSNNE